MKFIIVFYGAVGLLCLPAFVVNLLILLSVRADGWETLPIVALVVLEATATIGNLLVALAFWATYR